MSKAKKSRGRPAMYTSDTRVYLTTEMARSRLQTGSDRRAIVNCIIDHGGSMTMQEIDDHFGFNTRGRVIALIKSDWLSTTDPESGA